MKLTKSVLDLINENPVKYAKKLSIEDLENLLRKFSDQYYNTQKTLIGDDDFDNMKDVLREKDPTNIFLDEIGAPIKGEKNEIKLPFPMGSFSKIKPTTGDIEKWTKKYKGPYALSDKMDGSSTQIYKDKDGKITFYSRGNGLIGKDITHLLGAISINKKALQNLPLNCSVRGELILKNKDFEALNIKRKTEPRSTANGLVNSKTVDKQVAKVTNFISYAILNPRLKQIEQFETLKKWGFDVVEYKLVDKLSDDILTKYLKNRKLIGEYNIDGIVCVDDSVVYPNIEGIPQHAFAFKIDAESITAEVIDVIWEPSMDNYLKPVIHIKPVKIGGVTIKRVTAHNAEHVYDNVIGPGAIIKIIRSGDVIPKLLSVEKKATSGKPQMPDIDYKWNDTEKDIIATKLSLDTKNKVNMHIAAHFFKTMRVKYMGEGIIIKLVDNGYNSIIKILKAEKEDLINIGGIGDKIVTKIYDEIENQMGKADLARLMASSRKFGRCMGERKLREITNIYPNILTQKWSNEIMTEKILEIHGFSDVLTKKFVENFKKFKTFFDSINEIYNLDHMLVKEKLIKEKLIKKKGKKEESEESDGDETDGDETDGDETEENSPLTNQKIVFTGFRDEDLESKILKKGGKVNTSVSSNTTILVHKDGEDTTKGKMAKAKTIKNIKILSKSQFIEQYKL